MDQDMDSDSKEDVDMISPPGVPEVPIDPELLNAPLDVATEGPDPAPDPAPTTPSDVIEIDPPALSVKNGAPPLPDQIKTIETLLKAFNDTPVKDGDAAYLVSRRWLAKAQAIGGDAKHSRKDFVEGPLGPIDNSDIVQEIIKDVFDNDFVRLKPGTGLEHFELFSADAWNLIAEWHGIADGQLPIVRIAHNTAIDRSIPHIQFEFHPPVFTMHRLWSPHSPIPIDQKLKSTSPPPILLACSSNHSLQAFLRKAKQLAAVEMDRKVRIWRVTRQTPDASQASSAVAVAPPVASGNSQAGALSTPPDSPPALAASEDPWEHMLVEAAQFSALKLGSEREKLDIKDFTNDENYNGKSTLAFYSLQGDNTIALDENVEGHNFVSTYKGTAAAKEKGIAATGSSTSLVATAARAVASGRSSPAPQGPVTRGRAKPKLGRSVGCVGLSNLGNTCYMNSALQCVRSVEELTKYFLIGEAQKEVNTSNHLGHNGDVALAYSHLLRDLYKDPAPSSLAPRQFKGIIGRYAPAFSGYGQQDSQEFVGFLLDALQEDLSRIKQKPYIEKPDSTDEMINNQEAIREMANKVWDITKKRDDSVIADLFTGMFQSTLVCPECDKISITFDPFNNLTLPLPLQNVWQRSVKFVPLNDAPVEINVELDRNSTIKTLKEFVSVRTGVPAARLFGAEEFKDKFFKIYDNSGIVADEIQTNDIPVFFELEAAPTNVGYKKPKKKYGAVRSMLNVDEEEEENPADWDSPFAEKLAVPVIHRFYGSHSDRRRHSVTVSPPHFIIVTREEAHSEDAIRRKVLEKVASFSTWPEFAHLEEESADLEMVTAPASDADSAGDGKVIAKSVEGEDDMVDVTTTNNGVPAGQPAGHPAGHPSPISPLPIRPLKAFNTRRPKWVDSRHYLPAQFQNLFEMCYFSESDAAIPSGWQSLTDASRLKTLASRAPPVDLDMRSPPATGMDGDSGSDDSTRQTRLSAAGAADVTRMADESSDEDEMPNFQRIMANTSKPAKVGGRRVNRKGQRNFAMRGNKRRGGKVSNGNGSSFAGNSFDTLMDESESPTPAPAPGPLIRLGEGIVVNWNEEAWDQVYGSVRLNDGRGEPTFSNIETLQDPVLAEKKRQRALRRKNGISLDECLDEFEKQEVLSEQDTWYCPRCKEHRRATKSMALWKTPDILVVHLKRFSNAGFRRDKLDILVDFPIEGLDLTRRVCDQETGKEEVYDLIAIDDHWGGLGGGHYTAFAKNFVDGEWYEYNDSVVSKQKELRRMITSAAYLLFYRRRSDKALGGPRFEKILERYDNDNDSDAPDEEMSDSGEGQRLDTGSSLRGSSSALTGAVATHQLAGHGLTSGPSLLSTAMQADDDPLPSYEQTVDASPGGLLESGPIIESWQSHNESSQTAVEVEDDPPLGTGRSSSWQQGGAPTWSWDHLTAGRPKTGSVASDEAEGNSSVGAEGGFSERGTGANTPLNQFDDEFENDHGPSSAARPPPEEGVMGLQPLVEFHELPAPVPDEIIDIDIDIDVDPAQANLDDIRKLSWKNQGLHTIPADIGEDDDAASDRAVEIHLDDTDGNGSNGDTGGNVDNGVGSGGGNVVDSGNGEGSSSMAAVPPNIINTKTTKTE